MTTISHLYSLLLIKQSTNLVLSLQQGLTLNCYLILTVLLLLILPPLLLQVSLCQTKSLHPCINLKGICVAVCGSCSLRSLGFSVCEGKPSLSLSLSISQTDTHTHSHTAASVGEAACSCCPSLGQQAEAGGRPAAEHRASGFNEAPTQLDLREVSQSSVAKSTDGLWDCFVGAWAERA